MPIGGIERVVYGVDDIDASSAFYDAFGLVRVATSPEAITYRLEEGSSVVLRHIDDPALPPPHEEGSSVRETVFGIDDADELAAVGADLGTDREVRTDDDGTIHFVADGGMPLALRVWTRRPVTYAPDPVNAPDNIQRLNQHRRWRTRARPKTINHVVWRVDDIDASMRFFRDRLGFRLTDTQPGAGHFLRAPGVRQHHSVYFQQFDALGPPPHTTGFDHVAFGVEDIDEVYAGWNYMERRGYRNPLGGVGRHRIASAIFCYFDAPCGGMAEYGADTDYVDDSWVPRIWDARFGGFMWTSHVLPFVPEELEWEVRYNTDYTPDGSIPPKVGGG